MASGSVGPMTLGGSAPPKVLPMRVKLATIMKFLAVQAIPMMSYWQKEDDGHFASLLNFLFHVGYQELKDWLARSAGNCTLSELQDQMLTKMSSEVSHRLATNIEQSLFCAVMVDQVVETPSAWDMECDMDDENFDNSVYKEKAVFVLRWVDDELDVQEALIGLCSAISISSNDIVCGIKDSFQRVNLSMSKVRGQCYDGNAITGKVQTEVVKEVGDMEKRAVFTHCYGHSLMRACVDAVCESSTVAMGVSTAREVMKLVKCNRRDGVLKTLKPVLSPGALGERVLCPTRWTVSADNLLSVISNYSVVQTVIEEQQGLTCNGNSTYFQLQMFETLFGMILAEVLLRHCDILSRTLQDVNLSAADGEDVSKLTVATLQSLRCEKDFDLLWDKVARVMEVVDVDEASMPRRGMKLPKHLRGEPNPSTPKELYHEYYYEAVDLLVNAITERFNRPGYQVYKKAENLLLKAARGLDYREEFDFVVNFYGGDFDSSQLDEQLQALGDLFKYVDDQSTISFCEIYHRLRNPSEDDYFCDYSQVKVLASLLLVMPPTRGTMEYSLTALRRIRDYPRTHMAHDMLERLMLLHVNQDITDELDLDKLFCEQGST